MASSSSTVAMVTVTVSDACIVDDEKSIASNFPVNSTVKGRWRRAKCLLTPASRVPVSALTSPMVNVGSDWWRRSRLSKIESPDALFFNDFAMSYEQWKKKANMNLAAFISEWHGHLSHLFNDVVDIFEAHLRLLIIVGHPPNPSNM